MSNLYNIHNFIKVKISPGKLNLTDGYNHYLRYFQVVEEYPTADYEIKEFSQFNLPQNYFSGSDILRFENGFCLPKEKYAVVFGGEKITEYTTYANRATNLWLQALLLRQDLSFIHGAGIEINNKGIIFPAFGGAGKTLLVSELRKCGDFKFFGDDYVIADKNGNMHSYPSDFSIYDYHLPFFPELKNTPFSHYLRRREVFALYYEMKRAINFLAKRFASFDQPFFRGWHANYVKVPAVELIASSKMGVKTKLFASVFLERYNGGKIESIETSLEEMVKMVTGILNMEFSQGLSYLYALSTAGYFDMADFQIKQKETLQKVFSGVKNYRVRIPQDMKAGEYLGYMNKFINNLS